MKKQFIFVYILIILLIFLSQITLGFFDKLQIINFNSLQIGSWSSGDESATPEDILEYIDSIETIIETNPNMDIADILDYLYDILFDQDENGNPDFENLNELFEDYTLDELIDTVNLIIEFSEAFLIFNDDNEPIFPNHTTVSMVNVDYNGPLAPGEYRIINKVIQTANLSPIEWWSPFALQITIEAPEGAEVDIADYAIEVLFDATPFAVDGPFSYHYLIKDTISYNHNRTNGNILRTNNILVSINDDVEYETTVYRASPQGVYQPVQYFHSYPKPAFSGSWCRLPVGPNLYLGPLTTPYGTPFGAQQELLVANPKEREGLIVVGRANGTKVELRLDVPERRAYSASTLPIIPIVIIISRGLELDDYGNPLPYQSELMIEPKITMRVIEGSVWDG